MSAEYSPAIAVCVNWESGMPAQFGDAGKPSAIKADHDASPASFEDDFLAMKHFIDFTGEIERHHRLLAHALGMSVHGVHHRLNALLEWTVRAVCLQFIILDEVDSCF